ncbi:alcohol dehydrogenase catalytic domain-containing protein [Kocuria sediminis]|uniref:alcohol dehydrogenase (NADP(+)) n=1 Tax=Kocuria sediminis TaxID=1038857 RepID=A0A6N8GH64_9MICC|nr:NAD(P)-dependent alcohol dehydrogenase [Kocuria sediminis]MUN62049.1 alcohol dehydrogenase catalytic domain-containing protein [Kocuria sediminis]
MTTFPALEAVSADSGFRRTTIERRPVGAHDVEIEIDYAGICHSDIHTVRDEWGGARYPVTPGHEIVGRVRAVGEQVTGFTAGDTVGVGCFVDSCGRCEQCTQGLEQFCAEGVVATYNTALPDGSATRGGYSAGIVVDERFVLRVPEALDPAKAAPLLCAGITTYAPLKRWGAGPGSKVAVLGMGGLGHVAVKIAAAMGAEVTVLSQSLSKQEDGLAFGAADYFATKDPETFERNRGRFDLIINTVSADLPVEEYLSLLRVNGVLCSVGLPTEPYSVRPGALIAPQRVLTGSMVGGIPEHREMLEFCAEHGVEAEIELIGADEVDAAYDRVVASDVRYRFVVDVARTLA